MKENSDMSIGSMIICIIVIVATVFAVIVVFFPTIFQILWYLFVAIVGIGLLICGRDAINLILEDEDETR